MAFQEPRRQVETLVTIFEEPTNRTPQEATPRAFTPSTMTTTTIVDASASASHLGYYVVPEDGVERDVPRQVLSISGTTLTVDVAWNATTSVSRIRAWGPEGIAVATGSGSTTSLVCSGHNSTNAPNENTTDFWANSNYHLVFIGGQNAGAAVKITAFTPATGTFTFTPAVTSTVSGEVAIIRSMLRTENVGTYNITQGSVERRIAGFADAAISAPTTKTGTASFELPVRPLSASAASAVQAVRPTEMGAILRSLFTETRDTGALAHATAPGSGTSYILASGGSGFTVGGFVMGSTGEVGQVRSISSNTLTIGTSHITMASIAAGCISYASAWYKRKDTGYRTLGMDVYEGGLHRKLFHGGSPTITVSVSRDQVVRFAFNFSFGDALEYVRTRPVTKAATAPLQLIDTGVPTDAKASRCLFNGVNVLLEDFTIDLGLAPMPRPALIGLNQMDGFVPQLMPVSGSFRIRADEDDRASFEDVTDLMHRRATVDFLLQKGTAPTETFAMAIPALQVVDAPMNYADAQGVYEAKFRAILPQDVPGNSFNAQLPALSIGWL